MNKTKETKLIKAIQEQLPEIMGLKFGCQVVVPRGISDKEWNIKTYITGHIDVPERIGRKLNKENIEFIPVLQEYRTEENELNLNIDIEVDEIVKIIGREIQLADVLIALDKNKKQIQVNNFGVINHGGENKCYWDLEKPLHLQSDSTKDFLYEILINK